MAILKYIERTQKLYNLIKKKSTGTPRDFANKIGYSPSMLREDIDDLRIIGAEIKYSRTQCSYVFLNNFTLEIKMENDEMEKITGGNSFFINNSFHANNIVTKLFMFVNS